MKILRKAITVLSLLFFLTTAIFAQNQTQTKQKPFHFKRYALQFSIPDFLKFSHFEGSILSLKYHFNDHSAIRIGFSATMGLNNNDDFNRKFAGDSLTNHVKNKRDQDNYTIGLNIPYLFYFHPGRTIKFYSGIGPRFVYKYYHMKNTSDNRNSIYFSDHKTTQYEIGVKALSGVEWFVHSNMSLSLEYSLRVGYVKNKTTKIDEIYDNKKNITTYNKSSWQLVPGNIYLTLSIYL